MKQSSSTFIGSYTNYSSVPSDLPAFAWIGRSNVGKSSLLNMLVNRKNLARSSSTPGKTDLINYYLINKSCYFVDLPGYGWSRCSRKKRNLMDKMISNFIKKSRNLKLVFLLLDSRIPLQPVDLKYIQLLVNYKIPYRTILTKMDKQNQSTITKIKKRLYQEATTDWQKIVFLTSSTKKLGKEVTWDCINSFL